MLSPEHLRHRRREFLARIPRPVLLFAGGDRPRNYPGNPLPSRADGNFLFFFGEAEPGSAAFFDPEREPAVTLFLPERTVDCALWTGELPSFDSERERLGVDAVLDAGRLGKHVQRLRDGRAIDTVAVADPVATRFARKLAKKSGGFRPAFEDGRIASRELRRILADLRHHKNGDELDEMRHAVDATRRGFLGAMRATRPGIPERELLGGVVGAFASSGCVEAFPSILTVRGEVLHHHSHDNTLADGDLVLLDAGAEAATGYAADVTRTWPASGVFTAEQRAVYEIVLEAEASAVGAVRAGARYRNIHLLAARVIAGGLVELGLLRGDPDSLVERGAHALFFPHGVGHCLGLDAHDLESFGDGILYGAGRKRSTAFGLKSLRIDLDLEPGMVVTIEPGIYFTPAILRDARFREEFATEVDFARAETWLTANDGRGFGGIRIEDDVVVTQSDPEVLTASVPREIGELEEVVGASAANVRAI